MRKLISVLCCILVFGCAFLTGCGEISGDEENDKLWGAIVEVPEIEGTTIEDGKQLAASLGLGLKITGRLADDYSSDTQETLRLSNENKAGEIIARGSSVSVSIVIPFSVLIPDVLMRSEADGKSIFQELGIICDTLEQQTTEYPNGLIIAQSVSQGTVVQKGSSITLTIAKNTEQKASSSRRPSIVGKTAAEAAKLVWEQGIHFKVSDSLRSDEPVGTVLSVEYVAQASSMSYRASDVSRLESSSGLVASVIVSNGPFVEVPDVRLLSVMDAYKIITDNSFPYVLNIVETSDYASGLVIKQDPSPNSQVLPGTTIELTVSESLVKDVPTVVGMSVEEAGQILSQQGIAFTVLSNELPSDTIPAGAIAAQSCVGPSELEGPVLLNISSGPDEKDESKEMPDVVGMERFAAVAVLEEAGYYLADQMGYNYSDTIPYGTVMYCIPVSDINGVEFAPNGVHIVYSGGPANLYSGGPQSEETLQCPSIDGMTAQEAVNTLIDAGFSLLEPSQAWSETVPPGIAFSSTYHRPPTKQTEPVFFSISVGPYPETNIGLPQARYPDVSGLHSPNDVEAKFTEAGFMHIIRIPKPSDSVANGRVIDTTFVRYLWSTDRPRISSTYLTSDIVVIFVSSGPKGVDVPPIISMHVAEVLGTLTDWGFDIGDVTYRFDPSIPLGYCVDYSPKGTASLGSEISFVLSNGPEGSSGVPDLMGTDYMWVAHVLYGRGYDYNFIFEDEESYCVVDYSPKGNPPKGTVITVYFGK